MKPKSRLRIGFLILLPASALAVEYWDITRPFQAISETLSPPQPECCIAPEFLPPTRETLEGTDFTECIEQVCGKAKDLNLSLASEPDKMDRHALALRPEIERRFRPLLEKWLNDGLKKAKKDAQRIRSFLAHPPTEGPPTSGLRNFLTFQIAGNYLKQIEYDLDALRKDVTELAKKGTYDPKTYDMTRFIEREKTIGKMVAQGLTPEEAKEVLNWGIQAFRESQGAILSNSTGGNIEYLLLTQERTTFRQSVLNRIDKLIQHYSEWKAPLLAILGDIPKEILESPLKQLRTTRELISSSSGMPLYLLTELMNDELTFDIGLKGIKKMAEGKDLPAHFKPLEGDWVRRFKVRENFEAQAALLAPLSAKQQQDAALEQCLSTLSKTAASYLPQKQYAAKKALLTATLDQRLEKAVEGWLSHQTSEGWKAIGKERELIFPPSRDDWFKLAEHDLRAAYESDLEELPASAATNLSDVWLGLGELFHPPDFAPSQENSDPDKAPTYNDSFIFSAILKACDRHRIEPTLRDSYHSGARAILISWDRLKDVTVGEGTALHERGHALDFFIRTAGSEESQGKYKKLRACLAGRHVEVRVRGTPSFESAPPLLPDEEPFYHSEDFGDWVQGKLATDPVRSRCALISIIGDRYQAYTGDSKQPFVNPPIVNLIENDVHSSGVFRSLHAYWIKNGKFPDACVSALKNARYPTDWGRCEFN